MASAIPTNTYTISDSNSGLYATSPPQVGMDVYWSQESKADNQKVCFILPPLRERAMYADVFPPQWLITDDGSGNATIKSVAYNIEAWCKEPAQEGEDVTLSKAKRVWVINVTKRYDR